MAKNVETEDTANDPSQPVMPAVKLPPTRDEARALIFNASNAKPAVVEFNFNGIDLVWTQPTIKEMQAMRDDDANEDKNQMVLMLIKYSTLKDVGAKVFDDADYDALVEMPFSGSFATAISKISKLLNLNTEAEVKN